MNPKDELIKNKDTLHRIHPSTLDDSAVCLFAFNEHYEDCKRQQQQQQTNPSNTFADENSISENKILPIRLIAFTAPIPSSLSVRTFGWSKQ